MTPGPFQNTVPSNHTFLPAAAPRRARPEEAEGLHHRLVSDRITGVLQIQIVAVDPVRIGTGTPEAVTVGGRSQLAHSILSCQGRPTIAGSSLKGTFRSAFEAVAGGCGLEANCSPPCVACALFGQIRRDGQLQGRVAFTDALAPRNAAVHLVRLPRAFQPRVANGRRVYGPQTAEIPSEVPHLVCARGTSFEGRISLLNVRPDEIGALCLCMGLDRTFHPRVGGGKFAGLGRVRIEIVKATFRDGYRSLRAREVVGADLDPLVQGWIAAAAPGPDAQAALTVLRSQGGGR